MRNLPHLDFGLLEAVGHKVDVLKGRDDAFLFGCDFGVEGHYPGVTRERMLTTEKHRCSKWLSVI